MKSYLKYSILITLILAMTISLVKAPYVGMPFGAQVNPFESNPTTHTRSAGTTAPTIGSPTGAYDGDTDTLCTITTSLGTTTSGWLSLSAFNTSVADPQPAITWVSIQVKYSSTGFNDDTYKWQYSTDGANWIDLTAATISKFDPVLAAAQYRSFSQLAEPTDGTWDWTDISNLRVRMYLTRVGTAWDGTTKNIKIYEVWASVYSSPKPPVSSTTMSLQPAAVSPLAAAYAPFFVEVYVNDVTNLAGWQIDIRYDNTVIAPMDMYAYYPWTELTGVNLDPTEGNMTAAATIPADDPIKDAGLSGGQAVARIYFYVNDDGTGLPVPPNFSWLRVIVSFIGDPAANKVPHHVYSGYYGTPPVDAYLVGNAPLFPYGTPISTEWVEEYPMPGHTWHLSSWTDNEVNGILDASDQIDMTPITPPGPVAWFHVDQIWECNADPNTYVYMILTRKPSVPEFPLGIGILLGLAPAIPLIYLWRRHPKRRVSNP